mmetsp:Transcript_1872/g.2330  ORF Transcript_1872/g.2330 Transcript_1872/m.2330 type:complete len:102 (-) Transcript_1872:722-1027(-)
MSPDVLNHKLKDGRFTFINIDSSINFPPRAVTKLFDLRTPMSSSNGRISVIEKTGTFNQAAQGPAIEKERSARRLLQKSMALNKSNFFKSRFKDRQSTKEI